MKNNTKNKAYCFKCKSEQEILVAKFIIKGKTIKYIGKCIRCGDYLCRVLLKANQSAQTSSIK